MRLSNASTQAFPYYRPSHSTDLPTCVEELLIPLDLLFLRNGRNQSQGAHSRNPTMQTFACSQQQQQ
eukprot:jgi/Chlat1/8677/Chrsp88S08077